ncbi:DUF6301 family protein [Nocardia tengchongensis]|uniref:DUF6301 family protein n=1 Tax=Nocardia tengchongensis TaxID=2055889 RepID=UPI00368751F7
MYIESDKVDHIATVASSFDWTWTEADLPAMCQAQGWAVAVPAAHGTVVLRTDHMADRPEAYWNLWDKGGVANLIMVVTDKVDVNDARATEQLLDEFEDLVARFTVILGSHRVVERGVERSARWDRPNLVVRLFIVNGYINLYLVNPAYQEWVETPEELDVYE